MNWDIFWQVIGWVASGVLVVSLLQTRIVRLRIINLVGCLISIVFNAVVVNWPVVALNVALAAINIWQLWRIAHTKHDPASYAVVPVRPDSPLLKTFVTRHGKDIAATWPNHNLVDLAKADDCFMILREDVLVGLVAVRHQAGTNRGVVLLDYVTAPYRDSTPGEFVFRTSGELLARGYREILALDAPGAYYEKIGFEKVDGGYQLEL